MSTEDNPTPRDSLRLRVAESALASEQARSDLVLLQRDAARSELAAERARADKAERERDAAEAEIVEWW